MTKRFCRYCGEVLLGDGQFCSTLCEKRYSAYVTKEAERQAVVINAVPMVSASRGEMGRGVVTCANHQHCNRVISAAQVGNLCTKCAHEARR